MIHMFTNFQPNDIECDERTRTNHNFLYIWIETMLSYYLWYLAFDCDSSTFIQWVFLTIVTSFNGIDIANVPNSVRNLIKTLQLSKSYANNFHLICAMFSRSSSSSTLRFLIVSHHVYTHHTAIQYFPLCLANVVPTMGCDNEFRLIS